MNNEIEQIAQQNDMSIEFVRWFFNEKKAACGEHWFLALGAMWEGWKAREGEATALALTLEKSREASGCPAGVDLQDWVKQLAAECVTLKSAIEFAEPWLPTCDDEAMHRIEMAQYTPATDRIVAGIKADGVEEWVSSRGGRWNGTTEEALKFAKQLREGADK